MKLKVIDRHCPHMPGSIRERMWNLVVAMEGCGPDQIAQGIDILCSENGWSNTHPHRPADRMVESGHAYWEL